MAVTGGGAARRRRGTRVTAVRYEIDAWGVGELWFKGERLVWHDLPTPPPAAPPVPAPGAGRSPPTGFSLSPETARVARGSPRVRRESAPKDTGPAAPELADRVAAYFAGARPTFDDVELDLEWCTPFQRAVAEALRGVPYGEVVTYGELAATAGYPGAARAAGTFCAGNRFPLVLPCHRVVAAGSLGGYGSLGLGYKRRLLALEGIAL